MPFKEELITNISGEEGAGHAGPPHGATEGAGVFGQEAEAGMRGARGPWHLSWFPQTGKAGQQRAWERLLDQFWLQAIRLALG